MWGCSRLSTHRAAPALLGVLAKLSGTTPHRAQQPPHCPPAPPLRTHRRAEYPGFDKEQLTAALKLKGKFHSPAYWWTRQFFFPSFWRVVTQRAAVPRSSGRALPPAQTSPPATGKMQNQIMWTAMEKCITNSSFQKSWYIWQKQRDLT